MILIVTPFDDSKNHPFLSNVRAVLSTDERIEHLIEISSHPDV